MKVQPNENEARRIAQEIMPCIAQSGTARLTVEDELYEHYPPWAEWDADDREWFFQAVWENLP